MNWKTDLEHIYRFTTLHSWCNQTDSLVLQFTIDYKSTEEVVPYLLRKMEEEHFSLPLILVNIVLLNSFGYATDDIINLAVTALYDRLNKKDLSFLQSHLFNGVFPLPEDLTYDMTTRSFLSYRRAIRSAMKIDSVVSRATPQMTVLYMTLLLSCVEMNDQNRAMVAFLLFRIDLKLPSDLTARISHYMQELKQTIRELHELGDKALSQELNLDKGRGMETKVFNREHSHDTSEAPEITVLDQRQISDGGEETSFEPPGKNTPDTPNDEIPPDLNRDQEYDAAPKRAFSFPEEKEVSQGEPLKSEPAQQDDTLSSPERKGVLERAVSSSLSVNRERVSPSERFSFSRILNVFKPVRNSSQDGEEQEEKQATQEEEMEQTWEISFGSNDDFLQEYLDSLDKIPIVSAESEETAEQAAKPVHQKQRPLLKKNRIWLFLPVLLLLPLLLLIKPGRRDEAADVPVENTGGGENIPVVDETSVSGIDAVDGPVSSVDDSVKTEDPVKSEADLLSDIKTEPREEVVDSNDSPEPKFNQNRAVIDPQTGLPSGFPVLMSLDGNSILWDVSPGESIGDVWNILQEYRPYLEGTFLENISRLDWEDFYRVFKESNPSRENYGLIYPSENFTLPAAPEE